MKCISCKKEKEKLFRREGGEVPEERRQNQVHGKNDFPAEVAQRGSVCLDCIEKKMRGGGIVPANIIKNSTQIPSGDPLEWVANGLEEDD